MKLSIPLSTLSRGRLRAVLEVALCLALLLAGWLLSADMRAGRTLAGQASAAPAGFPRTVRDHAGDALRLPRPPSRIASQALVSDHFLFAVVPPSRIAAVSAVAHDRRYSYVADVVDEMDVAAAGEPEALLRRRPDLLIASNTARADYVALARGAGIPTFRLLTVFEDFSQIAEGLETVGRLTGEERAAERVIRQFRYRIAAAVARRARRGAAAARARLRRLLRHLRRGLALRPHSRRAGGGERGGRAGHRAARRHRQRADRGLESRLDHRRRAGRRGGRRAAAPPRPSRRWR